MTPEILITLLAFWVTLVVLQAYVHVYMIKVEKEKPIYMQWFIIRGMVAIGYAMAYGVVDNSEWWPILLYQISTHVVLFNPLIAHLLKKENYWYLGEDSGWLDRFFIKHPALYKTFYFASIGVVILSIVVIFNKFLWTISYISY